MSETVTPPTFTSATPGAAPSTAVPVQPSRSALRPLGLDATAITGGFWGERQSVNAAATLAHCQDWLERAGWTGNFRHAVTGTLARARRGREFSDSEVYKLLEALVWEAARQTDDDARAELQARCDELSATVAAAQEPDGYLNTRFGRPGQPPRYSDLEWGHELYCYGHLIQAGVAQLRTRGGGPLARTAIRAADHVCATFGADGAGICGHPEIETALAELARATGEPLYLEQARLFIERRGHGTLADIEFGRAYYQDDTPVRDADTLRGHAVRALYLACGATDVAAETGDGELLAAVERQWERTVARRTYITGGMGAHHRDESFGEDHVLPADRAYAETCAGVASVMLSWRLLLATGRARYADLIERTLYNVIAASPAQDGRAFFYTNTLHQRTAGTVPAADRPSPRAESGLRAPWFAVSCCPTNVARTLALLPAYLASTDGGGIQIHQYAPARIEAEAVPGAGRVTLGVHTDYPYDGRVRVVVEAPATPGREWTLSLRVPGWGGPRTAWLVEPDGTRRQVGPGTVHVSRAFEAGDEVLLELPDAPRFVRPDPRIDAVRGCVAVERGPLVYCAESADLPEGADVSHVLVDPHAAPRNEGRTVRVTGTVAGHVDSDWPYAPEDEAHPDPTPAFGELTLIPYHTWANRGPATMRVWLPTADRADKDHLSEGTR
ncbi:glycoside hydrolase family 127 protein [Streptomyces sp. WG7]|uniref:glycoside hydrolase family 127 protein n=1 Tax=Streptomyces sp. WG7 TaxID=3417650 RepID=UPI003CEE3469